MEITVENKYLLPRDVMKELGISRDTLYRWCDTGVLHPKKLEPIGWRVFDSSEIEKLRQRIKKIRRPGEPILTNIK